MERRWQHCHETNPCIETRIDGKKDIQVFFPPPSCLVVRQQVQKGNACRAASGGCSMLICIFSIKYSQPEGPPEFAPLKSSSLQGEQRVLASLFYLSPPPPHQADCACSAACDVVLHVVILFRAQ